MTTSNEMKEAVKNMYGAVAKERAANSTCCSTDTSIDMMTTDTYSTVDGYAPEADLGLGCGIPTAFALIKEGMTILDLGSGAGNDVFIASKIVGSTGKVIGVDMTREMISRAEENKVKLGLKNVDFRMGEIESLPVEDGSVDIVISNCVLNLVPDKRKAFSEIYRVLKPGGHFTVSDIVLEGELSASIRKIAEMWAGCISGAMQKDDYLLVASQCGFSSLRIEKEKTVSVPEQFVKPVLKKLSASVHFPEVRIKSITLTGEKSIQPPIQVIRRAHPDDLHPIRNLLSQNKLPDIELEEHIDTFLMLERNGRIIACAGLEVYGAYGLVRSVAVHPDYHSQGIGASLYGAIELDARMFFLSSLYLFTNEAERFFTRHGYGRISREDIPLPVHESGEYKYDCCEHAFVMMKKISDEEDADIEISEIIRAAKSSCCGS